MLKQGNTVPSTGRRIAVHQQPNISVSQSNGRRKSETNSGLNKGPRRIADPRDAKERDRIPAQTQSKQTRRISVATSRVQQIPVEKKATPQRRKSAPAGPVLPANTTQLSQEERLMIANFRLHQQNAQNKPTNAVKNPKISDQPRKNRKVSFFQPVEEVSLSPLQEEDEY